MATTKTTQIIEIEDKITTVVEEIHEPHPMVLAIAEQIDGMLMAMAPINAHADIAAIVLATIVVHAKAPMAEIVQKAHELLDKVLKYAQREHKECIENIQAELACEGHVH